MNVKLLKKDAESLFNDRLKEPIVEELISWYNDILKEKCRYAAFVVRRSYLLALLIEALSGIQMKNTEDKEYLTDAALILRCEEMSNEYRKTGMFPRIILIEDTILHGRGVNHLIECLENHIIGYLPDVPESEIKAKLAQAIEIRVFARYNGTLLLFGRYELRIRNVRCEDYPFIHELSDSISKLISSSGIANAAYIYSEEITPSTFNNLDLKDFIKTKYQNIVEYTKTDFIKTEDNIKAICSLRITSDEYKTSYRIIPFIFIANLDEEETLGITNAIFKLISIKKKDYLVNILSELYEIKEKRSFNELLTLIFSQAILSDFKQKNKIVSNQKQCEVEITKLVRNYNKNGETSTEVFLSDIINNPILRLNELIEILNKFIPMNRSLFRMSFYDDINYSSYREKQVAIRDYIEDYFYRKGVKEETEAFKLSQGFYYDTPLRSDRAVRGNGFLLKELFDNLPLSLIKLGIAYYLQMMDSGVLAISSFAKNNTKVSGFSQYVKVGELSLLTRPVRVFEYAPLLCKIQEYCWEYALDFKNEVYRYLYDNSCDVEEDIKEDILEYVSSLKNMGQNINDWPNNCLQRYDFGDKEPGFKDIIMLFSKQSIHVKCYQNYFIEI